MFPWWGYLLQAARLCVVITTVLIMLYIISYSANGVPLALLTVIYLMIAFVPRVLFLYAVIRKRIWAGTHLTASALAEIIAIALFIVYAGTVRQVAVNSDTPGPVTYESPLQIFASILLLPLIFLDILDLLFTRRAVAGVIAGDRGKQQMHPGEPQVS